MQGTRTQGRKACLRGNPDNCICRQSVDISWSTLELADQELKP